MGWKDRLWSTCGTIVNTAIDMTANAFNTLGSLACMAGGAGFAISYAVEEKLSATYFASANAVGGVTLQASLQDLPYELNETIAFQDALQHSDGMTFNLKDYLHPSTIKIASVVLFSSGATLRLLGENIKQWQQSRVDKEYFQKRYRIDVPSPAGKEYLHASAKSLTGSISYGFSSTAIVGGLLNSGLVTSEYGITYPSSGAPRANSTYYHGPLNQFSIPIDYYFSKNVSIDLFDQPLLATLGARIKAVVNGTYGGGLFLYPLEDKNKNPVALPAVIGSSSLLANSFFSKKAIQLRDDRIQKAVDDAGIYFRI